MLTCDYCGERYADIEVYLNDQGQFRCTWCLGWTVLHPVLTGEEHAPDEIVCQYEREACE